MGRITSRDHIYIYDNKETNSLLDAAKAVGERLHSLHATQSKPLLFFKPNKKKLKKTNKVYEPKEKMERSLRGKIGI